MSAIEDILAARVPDDAPVRIGRKIMKK